jgi:purine-nucleoside phosphorylase
MLILAARPDWIPSSVPSGVRAEVTSDAVALVRTAATAGVESVVMFVGGHTASGDCLVVSDHVNLTGANPLVGPNVEAWGVRFPDMTEPYPLRTRLSSLGAEGVAADIPEPPEKSDLRDAKKVGAESVTCGLAAAVIAANHCRLKVGAIIIPADVDGAQMVERALELITD